MPKKPKKPKKTAPMRPAAKATPAFCGFTDAEWAEIEFWRAKTPAARLRECERLRQLKYGYGNGKPLPRFQRVMRIVEMGDR